MQWTKPVLHISNIFKHLCNYFLLVTFLNKTEREVLEHHSRTLFLLYLQQALEAQRLQTTRQISIFIFIDSKKWKFWLYPEKQNTFE